MSNLWEVFREVGELYIESPDKDTRVHVVNTNDVRFARALCHLLNRTPIHDLKRTMEEMDQRGVPHVG